MQGVYSGVFFAAFVERVCAMLGLGESRESDPDVQAFARSVVAKPIQSETEMRDAWDSFQAGVAFAVEKDEETDTPAPNPRLAVMIDGAYVIDAPVSQLLLGSETSVTQFSLRGHGFVIVVRKE